VRLSLTETCVPSREGRCPIRTELRWGRSFRIATADLEWGGAAKARLAFAVSRLKGECVKATQAASTYAMADDGIPFCINFRSFFPRLHRVLVQRTVRHLRR